MISFGLILLASLEFFLSSLFSSLSTDVVFESLESKTDLGQPIYNEVKWTKEEGRDVWIMRQAQHGLTPERSHWERLVIEVDRTTKPFTATFYQLKPGPASHDPKLVIPLQANCISCHSNGPRALRPNLESSSISLSWRARAEVAIMNLRMKSYGPIRTVLGSKGVDKRNVADTDPANTVTFPFSSCQRCHSEGGLRNPLSSEQVGTSAFLILQGAMPPFPFQPTPREIQMANEVLGVF